MRHAEAAQRQAERRYQEALVRARKAFAALPEAQREALLAARKLEIAQEPDWAQSLAIKNLTIRATILSSLMSAARDSILEDVASGDLEL